MYYPSKGRWPTSIIHRKSHQVTKRKHFNQNFFTPVFPFVPFFGTNCRNEDFRYTFSSHSHSGESGDSITQDWTRKYRLFSHLSSSTYRSTGRPMSRSTTSRLLGTQGSYFKYQWGTRWMSPRTFESPFDLGLLLGVQDETNRVQSSEGDSYIVTVIKGRNKMVQTRFMNEKNSIKHNKSRTFLPFRYFLFSHELYFWSITNQQPQVPFYH